MRKLMLVLLSVGIVTAVVPILDRADRTYRAAATQTRSASAAATQSAPIEVAAKTAPQQKLFGPDDISTMVEVYKNNPVRFQRDYAGKSFEAVMPYNPVTADPSFGTNQQYSFLPAVICYRFNDSEKAAIAEWNRNDRIGVRGIIMPVSGAGVVQLDNCTFSAETKN